MQAASCHFWCVRLLRRAYDDKIDQDPTDRRQQSQQSAGSFLGEDRRLQKAAYL